MNDEGIRSDGDVEWLAWRAAGVGASDVAASWTGSYGGAYKVVGVKLGLLESDIDPELADRGHRWEQPIADAVHTLTGLYVVGEQAWCQHPDHPHMRATVDGFLAGTPETTIDAVTALIEIKTVGSHARPNWDYYRAQIQCQMLVTGVDRALLAVATISGDDQLEGIRLEWVDADPDTQTMLAAEYDRLWALIQTGELPAPDGPAALDLVKQATATADPDAHNVNLEPIAEQIAELHSIKQAIKGAQKRHDELDALVRHTVGAATKGICDGWTVTYSKPSRVLTNTAADALLLAYPELGRTVLDRDLAKERLGKELDDFKEPAGARRLTIKETK
jgi:putative phage-type endonuclease